jgi:heptosyltransferase-3
MPVEGNILDLLQQKVAQMAREMQRAVILQPGAIGDCILTLPLAKFMKDNLQLGGVDILGHTEYTGILPGRTCIDGIRSIDSMDLHRLFVEKNTFDLADRDPLINAFQDYAWIVTFLGEPDGNFEQNLIFTANCSHSAEIITLLMKPPEDFSRHLTEFYTKQFIEQSGFSLESSAARLDSAGSPQVPACPEYHKKENVSVKDGTAGRSDVLITTTEADKDRGKELLKEIDFDFSRKLIVIQPGGGGQSKCWHLDNLLAVAEEAGSKGVEVIFLLGPAELLRFTKAKVKDIKHVAKCLMDLSLTQVLGLLSCTDIFVGNDSGITHLAGAVGIQTFAVFGPTNPVVYRPIGPAVTVFEDKSLNFAEKPSKILQQELLTALLQLV